MKDKAFTLIELLGVIVILGILILITFPLVLKQIKKSKEGISESTKLLIIDAAKDYVKDNINDYDEINGMTYCIPLTTLIDNNYLNENLKDENLNNINKEKKVKLIYNNNRFNYDIVDSCTNNALTRNNIEVPIVTENSGLYKSTTDQDRFIYRGGEPNNYIWLDENGDGTKQTQETYRIISYESDKTIKVIRNDRILKNGNDIAFDERQSETTGHRKNSDNTFCDYLSGGTYYGCNVWGNTGNTYYNDVTLDNLGKNFYYRYFPSAESPNLQARATNGTVIEDSTLNTYLNNTWYETLSFKNLISEHSFNVGGVYYYNYYDGYRGGDKGIEKEKQEEKTYKWFGKIGLMSITEYTESSTNSSCTSVWSNYFYNPNNTDKNESNYIPRYTSGQWPCAKENFNYKSTYHQWSLSAYSNTRSSVWVVYTIGYSHYSGVYYTYGVRPAFYLKSEITLTGSGTETDPYKLN